jgi:hypothetical protein
MSSEEMEVICPYCRENAVLIEDPNGKTVWVCRPCDARANIVPGSKRSIPAGRLAKRDLRDFQRLAHKAFDPLWKQRMRRAKHRGHRKHAKAVYEKAHEWLANKLGISKKECSISWMDKETCEFVVRICEKFGDELKSTPRRRSRRAN